MSAVLDIAGWIALVAGGFFCLVGAIGLHRMPDMFTRMHATSVSDTLGVGVLTLGMLTQTTDWTVAVRLVIIVIVLYVTGAVASHALARAALHDGARPVLADEDGNLREMACEDVDAELAARVATALISGQDERSDGEEEGSASNS